jgi:hypothetical protein
LSMRSCTPTSERKRCRIDESGLGLQIQMPGFAAVSESVEVHSSIPTGHMIQVMVS